MAKTGPIILIDDDKDDQELVEEVLREMNVENRRQYFFNCTTAFEYLKTTTEKPFIILCDINLPGMNGLEFKKRIDEDPALRAKSIPFVFLSTSADQASVNKAYSEMTIQGFFKKENTMVSLKKSIQLVLDYWQVCTHPDME